MFLFFTVHVDDLILISPTKTSRLIFEKEMKIQFEFIRNKFTIYHFFGMTVGKNRDDIKVNRIGYIKSIISVIFLP